MDRGRCAALPILLVMTGGCGRWGFDVTSGDVDATRGEVDAVDTALIAHWTFDDDPLDGVDDQVGGRAGACGQCPAQVAGIRGGAYAFDPIASPQVVIVPSDPVFLLPAGTVTGWVRVVGPAVGGNCALQKVLGGENSNSWQICLDVGRLEACASPAGVIECARSEGTVIVPGAWHHVAILWDEAGFSGWLDGTPRVAMAGVTEFDSGDVMFGADSNFGSVSLPFTGELDDIRLYGRLLTATEIAALATP